MAKLARAVHLRDPQRNRDIVFEPGEEPAPEYAVLITNPNCWEGGKLPTAVKRHLTAQNSTSDTGTSQAQEGNDPDAASGDGSGPDPDDADTTDDPDDKPAPRATAKKTTTRKPAASQ
ncbi:hypothetical protein [Streptomyces cinereoruber]|uniref:hypothetical protein n=1 Tax=Streptomyces cinereoruber TaxID=67260 RepID=UPI0036451853